MQLTAAAAELCDILWLIDATIPEMREMSELLDRFGPVVNVAGLEKGSARGRSVDEIVRTPSVRADLLGDVAGFARDYKAPAFAREERTLIKLRAFFDARLPR